FVLSIYVGRPWLWWVTLGIFVVVWFYIMVVYAKNRFGVRYRLTSHRFFHETGILLHKTDLIEVIDIDDITYTRTIIDRFTGVGTIHIDSSDKTHPKLSIPGIGNVEEVARLFQDARHEERRRRAVHIESV
ncbi:MAG: PH domain-containing protein, partial [Planctomycetia bacterium]